LEAMRQRIREATRRAEARSSTMGSGKGSAASRWRNLPAGRAGRRVVWW
jgi:hypothetical protein